MRKLVKKKKRNQFNALHYKRVTGHFRYFFPVHSHVSEKIPCSNFAPPPNKKPKNFK